MPGFTKVQALQAARSLQAFLEFAGSGWIGISEHRLPETHGLLISLLLDADQPLSYLDDAVEMGAERWLFDTVEKPGCVLEKSWIARPAPWVENSRVEQATSLTQGDQVCAGYP